MVEKFCSFHGTIGNRETSSETACAIGFGYTTLMSNCKSFSANYSLILHTMKTFYLERFAMHGNILLKICMHDFDITVIASILSTKN